MKTRDDETYRHVCHRRYVGAVPARPAADPASEMSFRLASRAGARKAIGVKATGARKGSGGTKIPGPLRPLLVKSAATHTQGMADLARSTALAPPTKDASPTVTMIGAGPLDPGPHPPKVGEDRTLEPAPAVEQKARDKRRRTLARAASDLTANDMMTPEETETHLGVASGTLRNWRSQGKGPPHHRISARMIRYRKGDVDDWLAARRVRSTSESVRDE